MSLRRTRRRAELEAGLDTVREAPRDEGVLELIVGRPAVEEREVVDEAELDVEQGVVGDNWSTRGGPAAGRRTRRRRSP